VTANPADVATAERAAHQRRVWRGRTRRMLRRLPRRSNVVRYPLIKYWGQGARKRGYLWSWKQPNVSRALYVGWIVTLMPFGGIQILLAALLAVVFKANLTVAAGLQFVSNPLTAAPLYVSTYFVGKQALTLAGLVPQGWIGGAAANLVVGGLISGVSAAALTQLVLHLWKARHAKLCGT
jgi:hypothetical protein